MTSFLRFCSGAVSPAKVSISPGAFVQGISECQESRMLVGDTACVEPVISAIIAEVVKETQFYSGSFPTLISRRFFLTYLSRFLMVGDGF